MRHILTKKSKLLGYRLKQARLRRNLTLSECSDMAGIESNSLCLIEEGELSTQFFEILSLLDVYGLVSDIDAICDQTFDQLPGTSLINTVQFDKEF